MKKTKKSPPAATPQDTTKDILVNVILDRSGSMESCQSGTISGYNEYINGLKADKDSNYSVSLIQFDSPGNNPELTVSYADKPLAEVPNLSADTYQPRGGTPLYDAIGECVRRVIAKARAVITVIITDGEENSSHEFTRDSVKNLIKSKESEGWKFIFLGANIDSAAVGGSLGVAATACANYSASNVGVRNTFAAMSASNRRYATTARTMGVRAAGMSASFTMAEQKSMLDDSGGLPAAQPPFQPVTVTTVIGNPIGTVTVSQRKPRDWTVKQVPSA